MQVTFPPWDVLCAPVSVGQTPHVMTPSLMILLSQTLRILASPTWRAGKMSNPEERRCRHFLMNLQGRCLSCLFVFENLRDLRYNHPHYFFAREFANIFSSKFQTRVRMWLCGPAPWMGAHSPPTRRSWGSPTARPSIWTKGNDENDDDDDCDDDK